MRAAAAQVPGERLTDLVVCWIRIARQERRRGDDDPAGAVVWDVLLGDL